jgi:hypothetical protein
MLVVDQHQRSQVTSLFWSLKQQIRVSFPLNEFWMVCFIT